MSQYPITGDGRRLAEAHETARRAGGQGRWLAVRLSDGGTDGQIYDRRPDAVRHNDDSRHFYLLVQPGPMPPAEASGVIEIHRRAARAGFRFSDPAQTPIRPTSGPLPTTGAAERLIARGFDLPTYQRIRSRRDRRR